MKDITEISDQALELARELTRMNTKVNLAMRKYIQQILKEHSIDLTFEMVQVLVYVWENDGANQQEIADAILKDKASLTYLIDNLSHRKLVKRQEDNNDRRNKKIYVTAQGKELRVMLAPYAKEMYSTAGHGITQKSIKEAIEVLQKVQKNLSGS